MIRFLFVLFIGILVQTKYAQGCDCDDKKHLFSFYWGYNRSAYLKSDLTMHGNGYDYTLFQVIAHDRPYEFDPKVYFNLTKFSIPQFNIRLGYQINKKWWVSVGYDHMKYVVDANQMVKMSGMIDSSASSIYQGTYNNSDFFLTDDFLHFEHTDGLNFITVELDYVLNIWSSDNKKFWLENRSGIAPGILYPRTDVTVFNHKGPNIWNLAGGGVALRSEMRMNLWRYFFVQVTGKGGLLFLPKIQTTGNSGEYAKQNIQFIEGFWAIGANFRL